MKKFLKHSLLFLLWIVLFVTSVSGANLLITTQPTNQLLYVTESTVLTVAAAGDGPISYQWKSNGIPMKGLTNASWALNNVTTNVAADYSVTVSNLYETLESSVATISVVPLTVVLSPTGKTNFGGE